MKCTPQTAQSIHKSMVEYKLKPHQFPEGMIILQDTRERTPLFGPRYPKGMVISSCTLKDGDYSLAGHQDRFAIERKGISDLLSYVSSEREKTKAKMQRFSKMDFAGLLIESRESELYRPYLHSSISPELVRQCLISFQIRYKVHVYIGLRENCQRVCLDWMIKYWKVKREV